MARDTENRVPLNQPQCTLYQKQRPLAPAPYKKPTNAYYLGTTLDSNNPAVVRRNARERNRVKQVNNGFSNLRQHIPPAIVADLSNGRRGIGPGAHKKLSKVDTLRMAVEYIRRLKRVIDDSDTSDTSSVSSYNSCSSSISCSPTPMGNQNEQMQNLGMNYFQAQSPYYALSYSGSFQPQAENSISPADSYTSSNNSSYNFPANQCQMNSTPAMNIEEFTNTSADDDELLDYISLWQDEL